MKKITAFSAAFVLALTIGVSTAWASDYVVKKGDTLFKIGQRYGVSGQVIQKANSLKTSEIRPGQKLYIPGASNQRIHTVSKGESLWKVANKWGTSVSALKSANGLRSNEIRVGQKLTIPGAQSTRSSGAKVTTSSGVSRSGAFSHTREDLYWLAKIIHAESRGEPFEGQVAVGAVILSRVKHSDFPNSIYGVIYDKWDGKYYQFSPVQDGSINLEPNDTALRAAKQALNGVDPSGGALYFYNPEKSTSKWIFSRPVIKRIGKHVFAK